MKKYDSYRNLLRVCLITDYNLSEDEAFIAVEQSAVNKMLDVESSAEWQMHQPLRSTVKEIYEDYESSLLVV